MSIQLSSIVTGLQKEGISVAHSGRINAQRVTDALQERFTGPQPPDVLGLQLALAQLVEDETSQLLDVDAAHVREVVGNRLQMSERDESRSDLFETLSRIRSAVEGVYGEPARVELFGDVSALPQDPLELHRLGTRIHDQLIGEGFVLPPAALAGFPPLDRQQLADGLKQPLDRFGAALSTLSLERKDADGTLHDKTTGIEGYRRTVRFAAGCLASLYGLAGFDDLAAKVRPKRRGPRRPADGPDGGGPGETDTAAPDQASPEPDAGATDSEASAADDSAPASGPIGIVR